MSMLKDVSVTQSHVTLVCSLFVVVCCQGDSSLAGFDPAVFKTQIQNYVSSMTGGTKPSRQLEDAIKAPLMSLCAR